MQLDVSFSNTLSHSKNTLTQSEDCGWTHCVFAVGEPGWKRKTLAGRLTHLLSLFVESFLFLFCIISCTVAVAKHNAAARGGTTAMTSLSSIGSRKPERRGDPRAAPVVDHSRTTNTCGATAKSSFVVPSFSCGYQSTTCFGTHGSKTFGCRRWEC